MASLHRIAVPIIVVATLVVAGCSSAPPKDAKFTEIRFNTQPHIKLNVSGIEVVSAYKSPGIPPNVEHLFPIRPLKAVMRWGRDRLRAAGPLGVARMVVRRASVIEEKLKRTGGFRGLFTRDQSERYRGVIEVTIDILDDGGVVRGHAVSRIERSRTVREDISMAGRERVWHDMTKSMMADLNTSLEAQIRRHLRKHLRD